MNSRVLCNKGLRVRQVESFLRRGPVSLGCPYEGSRTPDVDGGDHWSKRDRRLDRGRILGFLTGRVRVTATTVTAKK